MPIDFNFDIFSTLDVNYNLWRFDMSGLTSVQVYIAFELSLN